jgi:hypothetical protein
VLELAQTFIWHTSWKMNIQNFEKAKQKIHDIWHDQPKGATFFAKMRSLSSTKSFAIARQNLFVGKKQSCATN